LQQSDFHKLCPVSHCIYQRMWFPEHEVPYLGMTFCA
jgi:hypothetical protein